MTFNDPNEVGINSLNLSLGSFGTSQSPEIRLSEVHQKNFGRGLQSGR